MLKFRLVGAACVAVLPSWLKVLVLRHAFGFHIGKRVHIGISLFAQVGDCSIADNVRIGHLNAFVNVHRLEIEEHVKIGFLNLFRGGRCIHIGRYATILRLNVMNSRPPPEAVNPTDPDLRLGEGAVVTNGHWLDFTDRIEIGDHTILGGRNSSLWTHNRQRTRPITVGAHSYLGSEIRMAPGASVSSCSIVSIGSVLTQRFEDDRVVIAGNPAGVLRPIRDGDFFLLTHKTRSDIPDEVAARSLPEDMATHKGER
jgi:acetyltransferase-like isoleucine patch superfamily enzyme